MIAKYKIPAVIIILLVVLGGIYFVFVNNSADQNEKNGEEGQLSPVDERGEPSRPQEFPTGETVAGDRKAVITYISQNISRLSPASAVLGGTWFVTRLWFADDSHVYVEYEDGHILRQILVTVSQSGEYQVTGYFEPGESGWNLVEGEDPSFGAPLDLYEYNETIREWVKRN